MLLQGGTLIQYEGKLRLLEVAQVAQERLEDFMSVKKFNVFNTNNLWISLPAIRRVVSQDLLDMEVTWISRYIFVYYTIYVKVIVNPVTLDSGSNGYQLVTAIGAAMKCFEDAVGVTVPRSATIRRSLQCVV